MTSSNWLAMPTITRDLALEWVQMALQQDIPDLQLLVFVNGSREVVDSLSELNEPRLHVAFAETNLGVGPAWNHICQLLFGGMVDGIPAEHILITNDDVKLRPDTYRELLVPQGGFVTPVNVGNWEEAQVAPYRVIPAPPIRLNIDMIDAFGPDFSCFLLRKWFYEKVGPFAECYPLAYYEDRDYVMMARLAGVYDKMFSVEFPYYHEASQTIKRNPEIAAQNAVQFEKNKQTFIERWGGLPHHETFRTPYGRGDNMKFAFDLDGTAWRYRTHLKEMAWGFKLRGHQIGIITGHDDSIREADLHLWEARGYPPADFLLNSSDRQRAGIVDHGQRNWKPLLAQRNGVSLIIDDWGTGDRLECWIDAPDETNL